MGRSICRYSYPSERRFLNRTKPDKRKRKSQVFPIELTCDSIDISGITKTMLLHAMVEDSRVEPGALGPKGHQDYETIDVTCSPPRNSSSRNVRRFIMDSRRYDEDHGQGSLQNVVTGILLQR